MESQTARAMRVALADFRGSCAQTAVGAGLALGAFIVVGWALHPGPGEDVRVASASLLLIATAFVLPLSVSASVAARHFQVGMRPIVGGRLHLVSLLVPASFFTASLYLIFGGDAFLALLIAQGAPSGSLLLFALPFQTDRASWPRLTLLVGLAGVAVTLGLTALLLTTPASLYGVEGAAAGALGPFAPLLYTPLAQLGLGTVGRLIPLRLRREPDAGGGAGAPSRQ